MSTSVTKIIHAVAVAAGVIGIAYVGYYIYFNRYWLFADMSDAHGPTPPWDLYLRPLTVLAISIFLLWWGFKKLRTKPVVISEDQKKQLVEQWVEPTAAPPQDPNTVSQPSSPDLTGQ